MGIGLLCDDFSGVGCSSFVCTGLLHCQEIEEHVSFCSFITSFFTAFGQFSCVLAIAIPLRWDLRFYIGLFICFLISSRQWCGGPRAGKVAIVIRFPFLHAGHLRCIKGAVSAIFGLPRSSCSSGIIVLL